MAEKSVSSTRRPKSGVEQARAGAEASRLERVAQDKVRQAAIQRLEKAGQLQPPRTFR